MPITETTLNNLFLAVTSIFSFASAVFAWWSKQKSEKNSRAIAQVHECLDKTNASNDERHAENTAVLAEIKAAVVPQTDQKSDCQ